MWDKNSKSFSLNMHINGIELMAKAATGFVNITGRKLKVQGILRSNDKPIYVYDLQLERKDERKPTQDQIAFCKAYLLGFADGAEEQPRLTGNGIPLIASH